MNIPDISGMIQLKTRFQKCHEGEIEKVLISMTPPRQCMLVRKIE